MLYNGESFNAATGQQYLRARWYDSAAGRFNRLDPWAGDTKTPVTLHKYLYCGANPVDLVDPSGMAGFGGSTYWGDLLGKNLINTKTGKISKTWLSFFLGIVVGEFTGAAVRVYTESGWLPAGLEVGAVAGALLGIGGGTLSYGALSRTWLKGISRMAGFQGAAFCAGFALGLPDGWVRVHMAISLLKHDGE